MHARAPSATRLHDVAAAAYAAVADDLDAVAHRVGHRRDEIDDRGRGVELATAVVRQRDGVDPLVGGDLGVGDGLDALDHDGAVPDRAQPLGVTPGEPGIHLARDVVGEA